MNRITQIGNCPLLLKLIVIVGVLLILLLFSLINCSSSFMKFMDYSISKPNMTIALKHLDRDMLKNLLDKGIDPNHKIKYNLRTTYPLIYLHYGWYSTLTRDKTLSSKEFKKVENDIFALTTILIEYGADVNVNDGVVTPLLASVQERNFKTATLLLSKGADFTDYEFSLLYSTIMDESFGFAKILIQKGADINVVNTKGNTILHELVLNNLSDKFIEKVLTNFNFDLDVKNKEGLTVYDIVIEKDRTEIIYYLRAN